MAAQPFFMPLGGGQRFCLFHPASLMPDVVLRGQVVYIHPFAEEMNKSRRMAALQARELAQAGFDVLQIDLLGCGDSSGDFGDATWAAWLQDVVFACQWLREHGLANAPHLLPPALWLWGLRAGCLLAAQAALSLQEPCNFLFWAPVPSGKPLLQQFLRLKAAADLTSGNAKTIMQDMRASLADGRSVEVAGYTLAADLASGLEQACLAPSGASAVSATPCRVEWFELSTKEDASLSTLVSQAIANWQHAGYFVHSHLINGPAFWQTTEIEDGLALIDATTAALLCAD